MDHRVELMAPLKNLQSLRGVLPFANAVYFGVEALNMRIFSDNIKLEDLANVVKICRNKNIKAYLTTNVIIYENEFKLLDTILDEAVNAEIDAIIVHDIGAIELVKEKGLDFHISTQANISNSRSARFFERLGAKRMILARELLLKQIKEIKSKISQSEIEVFIHGAQCTSISGRCYFSAEICGSQDYSANRGRCIQPCRREWKVIDDHNNAFLYDGVFFINTKDLCMIEYLPELLDARIDAFKIEGRMRDPIYIKEVTACYREAIDAVYEGNYSKEKAKTWLKRLRRVYNRGFSTGFYFERPKGTEIERKWAGNISEYRKTEIGKVLSYYPEKKAAKILLTSGKLRLNDEIFIIGTHTDTFVHQKISSIQIKQKKNLTETPLVTNKDNRIAVGIKVEAPVKKNDKIYILVNIKRA